MASSPQPKKNLARQCYLMSGALSNEPFHDQLQQTAMLCDFDHKFTDLYFSLKRSIVGIQNEIFKVYRVISPHLC